jgi:hypothetical protein
MIRSSRIGWITIALVAVGLVTLGAKKGVDQHPGRQDDPDPEALHESQRQADPRFEGHVTAVDPERREFRVDFGRVGGAEAGMILEVRRPVPNPKPLFSDSVRVGWLEVTSVGEQESMARVTNLEPDDSILRELDEPRPGDQVIDATDRDAFRILKLATGDRPDAVEELSKARLPLARRRLELARAFYGEGSLTIDRLIDASRGLMEAELNASRTRDERLAAIRGHLDRMHRVVTREASLFLIGSGSLPNLSEARGALTEVASMLSQARREDADDR